MQPSRKPFGDAIAGISMLGAFLACAMVPQLVAWADVHTILDIFVYLFTGCIILFWLLVCILFRLVTRGRKPVGRQSLPGSEGLETSSS
jgi:hypothetical protein